ncbi:MAG TPA: N-acetylmuramoyl-L-alanine amidase [Lysobacter sp.]|nr:N-acetylmuramoyl-L-alanine amidase [Lysobacter sp.]
MALVWNGAYASEIKALQLTNSATGTRAEIALDKAGEFTVISLAGPDRLVIDLPASSLAAGVQAPAGVGVVRSVRTGKPVPGTARIVFDLAQSVTALKPRIEQGASGPTLVVEWPGDGVAAAVPASAPPVTTGNSSSPADSTAAAAAMMASVSAPAPATIDSAAASAEATSRLISQIAAQTMAGNASSGTTAAAVQASPQTAVPTTIATGIPTRVATGIPATVATGQPTAPAAQQPSTTEPVKTLQQVMQGRGMRPLVIAIDPGHGGQDPGAVGQNGTREKDVVLAIGKELARQINATPGLKAYMTRDTDVFIPLNRRAALARAAKADMFISLHADAAENRGATGSSVYVLSLRGASSQRARWLADKENASDLVGGVRLAQTNNTLASVLLDLTQSGHMKASEDAAGQILGGLKRVGNVHKPQIERANFAVLRTSDMPAMLVETAFISNPAEEARLKDPAFQRKLADAVLDGVNTFFTRQPPPGTMYAARAAAAIGPSGAAGGSP